MSATVKASVKKTLYSVHPGVIMVQKWIAELPEKTGRSLEEWLDHIRRNGPPTQKAKREWLKKEHGLGTNTCWWLAERADPEEGGMGIGEEDPEVYLQNAQKYVEEMFAGGKAGLRPIYDELLRIGLGLAKDVKACPCKTIVPLYRNHVFAQLKPTTQTRLDLGLCLTPLLKAKEKLPARLVDTGGFAKKDRITHRIPITSPDEIDAFVKKWMSRAYELDA